MIINIPTKTIIDNKIFHIFNSYKENPVFICGYYKSGTSLLNSLLDYHPQLVSLLPDSRILFRNYYKALIYKKEDIKKSWAKEYIARLYNPTGHNPIHLLSDNKNFLEIEKYSHFRDVLKESIARANNTADILAAISLAIYACNGQFEKGHIPKYWAEKTPTNEFQIKRALKIYPNAKFIFIKRNIYDNLASIKRWYRNSRRSEYSDIYNYFEELKLSNNIAERNKKHKNFLLLKYEDLILNTKHEMGKVCDFLNINYYDILSVPTILGKKDEPNTSSINRKNKKTEKGIIINNVNKYNDVLSKSEIHKINNFFKNNKSNKINKLIKKVISKINFYFWISVRRESLDNFQKKYIHYYKGVVLDIGGRDRGGFRKPKEEVDAWIFADIEKCNNPDILLDASDMHEIKTNSIDIVNAIELFEHVRYPQRAISNIYRILKRKGLFIISSPFLFPLHADPCDYQRWTKDKWEEELKDNNFIVEKIIISGYFFNVLVEMIKTFCKSLPRIIRYISYVFFPLLDLIVKIDNTKTVKTNNKLNKFHAGYFIIAKKK